MNVLTAAHLTGHEFPGGLEALAPQLGKSVQVLRNELCPTSKGNKFGLGDADLMIAITKDPRILFALNATHGYVALPVKGAQACGDVFSLVLAKHAATGEFSETLRETMADGQITANELQALTTDALASMSALVAILQALQAMHASGVPA